MTMSLGRRDLLTLGGLGVLAAGAEGASPPRQAPGSAASRRSELYGLMGDLPDRRRAIGGRKLR
jgi:hypothetical protein